MQGRNTVNCNIHQPVCVICDRACKNGPCESKLHQGIFLLMSSIQNTLSHFHKLQKKAHWISSSDEDFVAVVINSYQVMIEPIQTKSAVFCTQMVDCCRPCHIWHTHNAHNVCIASTVSPSLIFIIHHLYMWCSHVSVLTNVRGSLRITPIFIVYCVCVKILEYVIIILIITYCLFFYQVWLYWHGNTCAMIHAIGLKWLNSGNHHHSNNSSIRNLMILNLHKPSIRSSQP